MQNKTKELGLPTKDGHFSILGALPNQSPQERDCWILGPRGQPKIEGFDCFESCHDPNNEESCLSILLLGWFRHFNTFHGPKGSRYQLTGGKTNAIQRNPSISLSRPHQADGGLAIFTTPHLMPLDFMAMTCQQTAARSTRTGRLWTEVCGYGRRSRLWTTAAWRNVD